MKNILNRAGILFSKESRLIEIKKAQTIIFIGDTHGDLEASQKVIKDYLKTENTIVFLGDYVDRGKQSKENLDFLIKTKVENPNQVYLLQGNHEGHRIAKIVPANFWDNLNKEDYEKYAWVVEKMPFAITVNGILALHGSLPDIEKIEQINDIKLGSKPWTSLIWGNFSEDIEESTINPYNNRPVYGKNYFFKLMERFEKNILIRSHQHFAPALMFNNKCLTLYTSSAYNRQRTIAIADFGKKINDAKDLEVKTI